MKVKELIEKLKTFDPEMEVALGEYDDCGDPFQSNPVLELGYAGDAHSWWCVLAKGEEFKDKPDYVKTVILRGEPKYS